MKQFILVAALATALAVPTLAAAQAKPANTSLGSVTIAHKVMADGKPLAPGTYQLRLTGEDAKPGAGQTADAERYVEFVRGGKVIAREVATVIPAAEIDQVAKSRKPANGSMKVEKLKGDDYVRIWINRGGTNYLINLPASS